MAKQTVKQTLDTLAAKWTQHLTRSDVTEPEQQAYKHALSLIERARTESPNKQLRVVQNGILHSMDNAKYAREVTAPDSMMNWEAQAKLDAYRQLREDMAQV